MALQYATPTEAISVINISKRKKRLIIVLKDVQSHPWLDREFKANQGYVKQAGQKFFFTGNEKEMKGIEVSSCNPSQMMVPLAEKQMRWERMVGS